jgi:hypothetical protein
MNAMERIKEIFSQAIGKKAGPGRDGFLAELCRGDQELRHQVESLLRAYEGAGEFLVKTMQIGIRRGSNSVVALVQRSGREHLASGARRTRAALVARCIEPEP